MPQKPHSKVGLPATGLGWKKAYCRVSLHVRFLEGEGPRTVSKEQQGHDPTTPEGEGEERVLTSDLK